MRGELSALFGIEMDGADGKKRKPAPASARRKPAKPVQAAREKKAAVPKAARKPKRAAAKKTRSPNNAKQLPATTTRAARGRGKEGRTARES